VLVSVPLCDVPEIKVCQECMLNNKQEWKNFFLEDIDSVTWRELWQKLLDKANIVAFSNASKEIMKKAYPNLKSNIEVTPHKVEDIEPIKLTSKEPNSTKTIAILGAINYAKGAGVVKELVELIEKENLNIEVVVIGEITENINSKHFKSTGKYKREDLTNIIKNLGVDIFLIPSIWPETFSYTTEEIIKLNMPLMVFNLGAPAERVVKYDKGIVLDKISTREIIDSINYR